jgi:hypothetical protein
MKTISQFSGLSVLLIAASGAALAGAPAQQGASLGTLEYGPTIYYPQGCSHNGSTVVCTFVFVHQAETTTIRAGGGGSQLTGIQFVDDAHVPHAPNNAYFVDRYGARQHLLVVNRADQGTMMLEFPLVDPRVTSGELHLGSQVLGGIPVGQGGGEGSPGAPNALAAGGGQAQSAALRQASAAGGHAAAGGEASDPCATPQMAKTTGCKVQAKGSSYATQATATANGVKSMTDAASQIGAMFGFKKPAPAPAQPPPQPTGNP